MAVAYLWSVVEQFATKCPNRLTPECGPRSEIVLIAPVSLFPSSQASGSAHRVWDSGWIQTNARVDRPKRRSADAVNAKPIDPVPGRGATNKQDAEPGRAEQFGPLGPRGRAQAFGRKKSNPVTRGGREPPRWGIVVMGTLCAVSIFCSSVNAPISCGRACGTGGKTSGGNARRECG